MQNRDRRNKQNQNNLLNKEEITIKFYIDFENVSSRGFQGCDLLGPDDEIFIFFTKNGQSLKMTVVQRLLNAAFKATAIRVPDEFIKPGVKNTLDFFLIARLYSDKGNKETETFIVSEDRGYECAIEAAKINGFNKVYRIPFIQCAFNHVGYKPQSEVVYDADEDADYSMQRLQLLSESISAPSSTESSEVLPIPSTESREVLPVQSTEQSQEAYTVPSKKELNDTPVQPANPSNNTEDDYEFDAESPLKWLPEYSKQVEELDEEDCEAPENILPLKRKPIGIEKKGTNAEREGKKKKVRQILSRVLTDEEYQNCGQTIIDCVHLTASQGKHSKEQFYRMMLNRFGKKIGGGLYKKVRDDYDSLAQYCEVSSINI